MTGHDVRCCFADSGQAAPGADPGEAKGTQTIANGRSPAVGQETPPCQN